jgi:hypothetical protein
MSQEEAMANVPQQERCDIARIGFFGKGRMYEASIRTDDECQIPHFHIRNIHTETDTPILLQSNHYCPHSHKDCKVLSDTELQQLACFMAEPCRSPRFENTICMDKVLICHRTMLKRQKGCLTICQRISLVYGITSMCMK